MQLLDGEIAALLEEQNTDLFTKSWQAQAAFEHVLRIGREVDVETAPPGCAPLPSRGTRLLPTTCPKCGGARARGRARVGGWFFAGSISGFPQKCLSAA